MGRTGKKQFNLKSSNIDAFGKSKEPAGGTKEESKNKLENVSSPRENEKNKKGNIPERDSRHLSVKTYQKRDYSNINMYQSVDKKSDDGQFQCSKITSEESNFDHKTKKNKGKTTNDGKTSAAKINEVSGDLFDCPSEYSMAHCVAEDLSMGSGIAVVFKKLFKKTGRLMDQHKSAGQMAFLEDKGRFIYYLVTKKRSFQKPTLDTLKKSLEEMKSHAVDNSIKDIAMPAIGSGLDRLDWNEVLEILRELFANTEITIHVYVLRNPAGPLKPMRDAYVKHVVKDLVEMQNDTARIYIGNPMGHITEEMKLLDTKHKFISEYSREKHNWGDMVVIQGAHDLTYGFICQDSELSLSYEAFENCVSQFRKRNKNDNYIHVGIQAFTLYKFDKLLMAKLEILLKNGVGEGITIWICWPEELKHLMPEYPPSTSVATESTSYH